MQEDVIRAWWAHRQGLDGSLTGVTAAAALAQTGWARSVGGASPYVTLFARTGASRADVDAAMGKLELHELPAARGCTYVVPGSDFALALRVGQGFGDEAQIVTAKNYCGVTDDELARLSQSVLDALALGPLDPRALKDAVGDAVRSLGAEGKKRGMTTTLPLALGRLQTSGAIRRVPVNGRIDQQRYRYTLWQANFTPPAPRDEIAAYGELARHYFRWSGPARVAQFQWFAGISGKVAREAIAPLGLVPLAPNDDRLLFPDDLEAIKSFKVPSEPRYILTTGLDNLTHLRRDFLSLLDEADQQRQVLGEKGQQELGGLSELPDHPILDRGRLIGLWQYDPETASIVWATFAPHGDGLREAIA